MQKVKVHITNNQNVRFYWTKECNAFVVAPQGNDHTILRVDELDFGDMVEQAGDFQLTITRLPVEKVEKPEKPETKFDRRTLQIAYRKVAYYATRIQETLEEKAHETDKYKLVSLSRKISDYRERRDAIIGAYTAIGIDERVFIEGLPDEG